MLQVISHLSCGPHQMVLYLYILLDGETMDSDRLFIFLGSKTTVDDDSAMKLKEACSLEEKQWQT